MLFDDPAAGLDPLSRHALFELIVQLRRDLGFTAVIFTQDLVEALEASDRVALLAQGQIRFEGAPRDFMSSQDPIVTDLQPALER